jgi:hypothetical protein
VCSYTHDESIHKRRKIRVLYPTDEEFDSNGRRATANMTFNKAEERQMWMDGYKAGFKIGWDNAKNGK